MLLAGTTLEEGLDWGLEPGDTGVAGADPSRRRATRCVASALYLRGAGSAEADASALADERLYPAWQPEPLRVACSPCRFDGYEMSATLLSNCQTACPPVGRMLGRAYQMYDAGAYVHQYEEHGVGRGHFEEAFARVEDVLAAYRAI
jgi:tubulin delta